MVGNLAASERLGDYELLHEIKSGGMGKILLARKAAAGGFEKLVAIKTILGELSGRSELRTMFFDEARLLARLQHPAVAQVYDFGQEREGQTEGRLFLVMEYVQGVSFAELVRKGTPPEMSVQLVAEVCEALHAAHALRDLDGRPLEIVHRDVSPDNLMLSYDGHVKVLDFGIALMRGRHSPATEYGTIKGKPPYLAPEQVKSERIDGRTDLWAAGVVLWELLTGESLFRGDSLYAVARAVEEQPIPAPSTRAGQLPEGLDAIALRALSRDPDQRFQSGKEMAEELWAVARSVSAPSVVEFAAATLEEERTRHQEWLRELLRGEPAPLPIGRPTGMRTAVAGEALAAASAEPRRAELLETGEEPTPAPARDTRRVWLVPLSLLLFAGLGTALWLARRGSSEPAASALASAADSGAAVAAIAVDAGSILRETASDASVADAGAAEEVAVVEAQRGGGRRGKRKPKQQARAPEKIAPPPPDPEPPKTTGKGKITVAAEPFALVRVDGVEIGATPLFGRSFPAGRHVVELIHPDTGKVRLKKTVDLKDGDHERVIDR